MKNKMLFIIMIAILLAGVIGSVIVLTAPSKSHVRVISDGETVYSGDLSLAADTTFAVDHNGQVNTVEIRDHRIRVKSADCPDQTCVKMGWLSSSSMPIVCLPHKMVIEFTDEDTAVDAVTR